MTAKRMMEVMPSWTMGEALGHGRLALAPVMGGAERFRGYWLAHEAMASGALQVAEVSESGSVPDLLAANEGARHVLLLDGEELRGAMQNRILNTSVFLAPQSKTAIPVSCVERGRWHRTRADFESGHYAPSSLRRRKSADVRRNLRACARPLSDQGAVWDQVDRQISACMASAPTGAMSDAIDTLAERLRAYREALAFPAGACGVVAAIGGRFAAADIFDSPTTLEAVWPRLVDSYAMDAETGLDRDEFAGPNAHGDMPDDGEDVDEQGASGGKPLRTRGKSEKESKKEKDGPARKKGSTPETRPLTSKTAQALLEHVAEQEFEAFDSVGLGKDLRFESPGVIGQALRVEATLLHLCLFPATNGSGGPGPIGRFRPPSQRRR